MRAAVGALALTTAMTTSTIGCGGRPPAAPVVVDLGGAAPPAMLEQAPAGDGDVTPATGIAWLADGAATHARAAREDRPLLVFFDAAWCVACTELEQGALADPRVVRASRAAVAVHIDVTDVDDPASVAAMERYGARGLPTLLVIGPDGRERFRGVRAALDLDALERALLEP